MSAFVFPAAVLASHTAFIGKTGSGKTSTGKLAIEQVVADGARVCVLDPIKSDWWGITSSADGKRPGLPFKILGGPHGHVPLHSGAGAAIGKLVGEGQLPLSIIDMADFEAGGLQRFFVDFAAALMRHSRGVLHLVMEEAHEFAPKERAGIGQENLALHWSKKLATAGRSKGIRLLLGTQRVQSLHNAMLGSAETLVIHRLTAPADQDPVMKWLKANVSKGEQTEVEDSLSSLPTGTGWMLSGEAALFAKVAFPKFATYDNHFTPEGDDEADHVAQAPVDPVELQAIIGEAVAQALADDPKHLKAEVARLKAELARGSVTVSISAEQAQEIRNAARKEAATDFFDSIRYQKALGRRGALSDARDAIEAMLAATELPDEPATATEADAALTPGPMVRAPVQAEPPIRQAAAEKSTEPSLVKQGAPTEANPVIGNTLIASATEAARQKVRAALAELEAMGVLAPQRELVSMMAGYSNVNSKSISGAFATLQADGHIARAGDGRLALTPLGREHSPPVAAPSTPAEMRARIVRILSSPTDRVLKQLVGAYPAGMTRADLAAAVGYTNVNSKAFSQSTSRLRDLGFAESRDGQVYAAETLFPSPRA